MFLDGMSDNPSRLLPEESSCDDHTERNPLDGVEQSAEGVVLKLGLAEEGDKELCKPAERESESRGAAGKAASAKVEEQNDGDDYRGECDVERDGVQSKWRAGDVGQGPGKGAGEAGIAAFSEVAEREEGPSQGGAGGPGVERGEKRKFMEAEVDCGGDGGEEKSQRSERRDHQEKDGVAGEGVEVSGKEEEAREDERGDDDEEAGAPQAVRAQAGGGGSAEAKAEREHESHGGEEAEGGDSEESDVKEGGVHEVEIAGPSTATRKHASSLKDDTSKHW
jgi:hypothetical protein